MKTMSTKKKVLIAVGATVGALALIGGAAAIAFNHVCKEIHKATNELYKDDENIMKELMEDDTDPDGDDDDPWYDQYAYTR